MPSDPQRQGKKYRSVGEYRPVNLLAKLFLPRYNVRIWLCAYAVARDLKSSLHMYVRVRTYSPIIFMVKVAPKAEPIGHQHPCSPCSQLRRERENS